MQTSAATVLKNDIKIRTGGGDTVEIIEKSNDFLGLNKFFRHTEGCAKPDIFYNRLKPIIVNAKQRNVEVISDSPPLIIKPAPVLIRRPGRVEVRPIIVKHRPETLVVPKRITKITRPVVKKFYQEKFQETEYPCKEEIIEEEIKRPFLKPSKPTCARTGDWLYNDIAAREDATIAEAELFGIGPRKLARKLDQIEREEEAIADAETFGDRRNYQLRDWRNYETYGFNRGFAGDIIEREEEAIAEAELLGASRPCSRRLHNFRNSDIIEKETIIDGSRFNGDIDYIGRSNNYYV